MSEERKIAIDNDRLKMISKPILQVLNDLQFVSGFEIDEVMATALYIIGAGLKKRGVVLLLDAPLRAVLPPLVDGYNAQDQKHE